MTIKEKAKYVEQYMFAHWGQELAEILWRKSCFCTTEEEMATLADLIAQ